MDWPCSERRLRVLAQRLAGRFVTPVLGRMSTARELLWPGQLARNGVFLGIVLAHGFRRLLPPY
jgi:hypothetical protein